MIDIWMPMHDNTVQQLNFIRETHAIVSSVCCDLPRCLQDPTVMIFFHTVNTGLDQNLGEQPGVSKDEARG